MNGNRCVLSSKQAGAAAPAFPLPRGLIDLPELHCVSIDRRLGYFRDERLVIFGYCPGGQEVVWKDGHSAGFGTGGWQLFLEEIAPLAKRRGCNLGSATSAGTHVLLMDRARGTVYAAKRELAEGFLSRMHGQAPPARKCLCSLMDCAACPVRTCSSIAWAASNDVDQLRGLPLNRGPQV